MTEKKRSRTNTLGSYADCWPVLDAALAHNGLRIPVGHAGRATTFRHRLYRARKMLQNKQAEAMAPGEHVVTPYDVLSIQMVPHDARGSQPADLRIVIIEPDEAIAKGITDLKGNPVTFEQETDALEADAAKLRRDLGLE